MTVQENLKRYYEVDTSQSKGVMYVNWMEALTLKGFLWMWRTAPAVRQLLEQSDGLIDTHIGILSPRKLLIVSYWENEMALRNAYKNPSHVDMMRFAFQSPDALTLGNETYRAPYSTRYLNTREGFALVEQSQAMTGEEFMRHHSTADNQSAIE